MLNRDVKPNSRASARVFVKRGAAEEAAGGEAVCFLATFQPELSLCVGVCVSEGGSEGGREGDGCSAPGTVPGLLTALKNEVGWR